MTSPLSLHRLVRRPSALLGLLLLALFARGLVAPGFMPVFGQGGAVAIVLCTPQGPATRWTVDAGGTHAAVDAAGCAFGAALGMAGLLPELPSEVASGMSAVPVAATTPARVPAGPASPYRARGPPAYS